MWTAGVERSINLSRHPEGAISMEQAALVNSLVTNTCDTLKEGFLNNPRACKVDFSSLKFTDAQMKTVETFYGGVKNSKGELIFSGQALGNPIGPQRPTNQAPGGVFDLVRIAYNDPNVDWQKFDLDRDMKYLDDKIGYVDAVNPDLSKFKKSGGKLLLTAGRTPPSPRNDDLVLRTPCQQDGQDETGCSAHGAGMRIAGGPGVNT
jgi:feruloyl esterase